MSILPPGRATIKIEIKYSNGAKDSFLINSDSLNFDVSQSYKAYTYQDGHTKYVPYLPDIKLECSGYLIPKTKKKTKKKRKR